MGGIRIGKIFGFEINIDWSWLFIFFLVVFSLSSGYFPHFYPEFGIATSWLVGVLAALLLFVSVLIHELSHSIVARRYGNDVRGITLFLFGGVSMTSEEPSSPKEEFWMAVVGPFTSLILSGFFFVVGGIFAAMNLPAPMVAVVGYLSLINLVLAFFNMVPGFPLDGGRILRSIVWAVSVNVDTATRIASYSGQGFGYLLMAFGFLDILSNAFLSGLWLIFIGWFLAGTARASYQQLRMREALSGVRVDQVMTTDVPVIPADMSVRQFVDEQLLHHDFSCYPVVSGEEILGIVGIDEVRSVTAEKWETTTVGEIVHSIDGAYEVDVNDDAWDALAKLASENVCRLVVLEDGRLKGTVGRETVFRLVQTKLLLGT